MEKWFDDLRLKRQAFIKANSYDPTELHLCGSDATNLLGTKKYILEEKGGWSSETANNFLKVARESGGEKTLIGYAFWDAIIMDVKAEKTEFRQGSITDSPP